MLKQLIKIIWKKKRSGRLLMLQFFGSYIICFLLLLLVFYYLNNKKVPLGFNYKNVWFLNAFSPEKDNMLEMPDLLNGITNALNADNNIKNTTVVKGNVPFMLRFWKRNIKYKGKVCENTSVFFSDDNFADVMRLKIVEGRWFNQSDNASNLRPVVINKRLKNELFGNEDPIGKTFDSEGDGKCVIVGLIDEYRYRGELSKPGPACFFRTIRGNKNISHNLNDEANNSNLESLTGITFLIRTKGTLSYDKQVKFVNYLDSHFTGINFYLKSLDEMRKDNRMMAIIPVIIVGIICAFLILNLFVGLFGVLWYNINLRKHEIGVRLSMGATKDKIYKQFITEMLILASLGILPGFVIALQFPVLKVFDLSNFVYFSAIIMSVVFLFAMVAVCAFLPGKQASKIQPALVLHEE